MKLQIWKKPATAALALILLSIPACLPSVELTPPPTATVSPTIPPTETIIWFPPTATWTPFPTFQPSATPEIFPGLGAQVFTDDFSNPRAWMNAKLASDGSNNIIVSGNRLTLAANAAPASLVTLRSGLLVSDFYAQTDIAINRCAEKDSFGMLFRAGSAAYTYRYVLTCEGQLRVDRLRGGEIYPLSKWETSGDLPPGAPARVKMGIWVAGVEMRFFLNNHYQFSAIDPLFKSGGMGYFASAVSAIGVNVSFSNLTVNDVSYSSPTPTLTPSKTPLPSRTPRPKP